MTYDDASFGSSGACEFGTQRSICCWRGRARYLFMGSAEGEGSSSNESEGEFAQSRRVVLRGWNRRVERVTSASGPSTTAITPLSSLEERERRNRRAHLSFLLRSSLHSIGSTPATPLPPSRGNTDLQIDCVQHKTSDEGVGKRRGGKDG